MPMIVTTEQIVEKSIICHKTLDCENPSICLGRGCMAWCWVPETKFDENTGMDILTGKKATKGFCGLINK